MNKLKCCPTCGKAMYSEVYYNHITGNSYLKYYCLWCETIQIEDKVHKQFIEDQKKWMKILKY